MLNFVLNAPPHDRREFKHTVQVMTAAAPPPAAVLQRMEAAVVARPDEQWGETPCAFVELKHDAGTLTQQDIIAFCREHLARFKVPRTVVFGELPKTSTGKVQKFKLREQAATLKN